MHDVVTAMLANLLRQLGAGDAVGEKVRFYFSIWINFLFKQILQRAPFLSHSKRGGALRFGEDEQHS